MNLFHCQAVTGNFIISITFATILSSGNSLSFTSVFSLIKLLINSRYLFRTLKYAVLFGHKSVEIWGKRSRLNISRLPTCYCPPLFWSFWIHQWSPHYFPHCKNYWMLKPNSLGAENRPKLLNVLSFNRDIRVRIDSPMARFRTAR